MTVKKKALALAAVLALCLSSIGVTTAYFTDYERGSGGAVIELGGQTKIKENVSENNKIVSIVNTGQTDMIVRVGVFSDKERTEVEASGDWLEGADGWYYYRYVLAGSEDGKSGDSTTELNVTVKADDPDAVANFDILVAHESSQAVYDGQSEPGADGTARSLVAPSGWDAKTVAKIKKKN